MSRYRKEHQPEIGEAKVSLTSELSSSTSWVNKFFKSYFARVVEFTRAEGPRVKALERRS